MKRVAAVFALVIAAVLATPRSAAADQPAFRTVIDSLVPSTPTLTIIGTPGGCDFTLQNKTGQDVLLFDLNVPPKPVRFPAASKQQLSVHLVGAWPCTSLPAITEDERWNHNPVTVLLWSLRGQVGAIAFQLHAHTVYDPTLDPSSGAMLLLRMVAGALAVGGLVIAGPYLLMRRRQIFA